MMWFDSIPILLAISQSIFVDAAWSIIATDRFTGQVGVAAVTCRSVDDGSIFREDYWLEPGKLVAAAQASAYPCQAEFAAKYYRDNVGDDLNHPKVSPKEAVRSLNDGQYSIYDSELSSRCFMIGLDEGDQVALVDMKSSYVEAGSSLGRKEYHAKGRVKREYIFSVQGTNVTSSKVIKSAKKGFTKAVKRKKKGCNDLAESLMQGLLEGSKKGGDKDCNAEGSVNIYYFSVLDLYGNEVLGESLYNEYYNNADPVYELYEEYKLHREDDNWCNVEESTTADTTTIVEEDHYLPPLKSLDPAQIIITGGILAIVALLSMCAVMCAISSMMKKPALEADLQVPSRYSSYIIDVKMGGARRDGLV